MFFCYLVKRCMLLSILLILGVLSVLRTLGVFVRHEYRHVESLDRIPLKIWQINPWEDKKVKPELVPTWIVKNIRHTYSLLTPSTSDEFVQTHFSHTPSVMRTFLKLRNGGLKADLLRYLVIAAEGGVYSDLDTELVQSVDEWIPDAIKERVRVVIGIEYDQGESVQMISSMFMPLQFCQWTFAATRDHPLMKKMVSSVVSAIQDLADEKEMTLEELEPDEDDILKHTGPAMFSHVVFEYLSEIARTPVTPKDISGLKLPRLYADVLIMPINSFATGIGHSGSSWINNDMTLIRHHFHSTWRDDIRQRTIDRTRPAARWSFPEVAARFIAEEDQEEKD